MIKFSLNNKKIFVYLMNNTQFSYDDSGTHDVMQHQRFMHKALQEARKALTAGEIPVGAVIVRQGVIIGRGHNLVETLKDPTAHAEMVAITAACETVSDKYLSGATLYVTLEPCAMCSGALVWSRLDRVVFGASDPKAGGSGSIFNITSNNKLNHQLEVIQGVLEEECSSLLVGFFARKRA
jgi:tRNA(adenine34) deaminase